MFPFFLESMGLVFGLRSCPFRYFDAPIFDLFSSVFVHSNDLRLQYFMFQIIIWFVSDFLFVFKVHKIVFLVRSGPFRYFHTQTSDKIPIQVFFILQIYINLARSRFSLCFKKSKKSFFLVLSGPFLFFLTQTSDVFSSVHVHSKD